MSTRLTETAVEPPADIDGLTIFIAPFVKPTPVPEPILMLTIGVEEYVNVPVAVTVLLPSVWLAVAVMVSSTVQPVFVYVALAVPLLVVTEVTLKVANAGVMSAQVELNVTVTGVDVTSALFSSTTLTETVVVPFVLICVAPRVNASSVKLPPDPEPRLIVRLPLPPTKGLVSSPEQDAIKIDINSIVAILDIGLMLFFITCSSTTIYLIIDVSNLDTTKLRQKVYFFCTKGIVPRS